MARKKNLNEFAADDMQSSVPDPIDADNPQSNARPADNSGNGDTASQALDSRLAFMAGVLSVIRGLSDEQLAKVYGDMMPYINGGGDNSVAHGRPAATPNQATLNPMSAPSMPMQSLGESLVDEELDTLLEEAGFKDEFLAAAKKAFFVAVSAKAALAEAKAHDEAEKKLDETKADLESKMEEVVQELSEGISDYLTLVTEKWFDQNELAIESGYKVQIGESILAGLKTLAEDHAITIEEEKIDVVADLQKKLEALTESYNVVANELVAEKNKNTSFAKDKVIAEASKGLTLTEANKLKLLAEKVEFKDEASFKGEISNLRESYINSKTTNKAKYDELNENTSDDDKSSEPVMDDRMKSYLRAVSDN